VLSGVLGAPHSNRWEHRWRRFAKGFHSGRMSSNRGTRALRGQSAVSSTLSKDNRRGRRPHPQERVQEKVVAPIVAALRCLVNCLVSRLVV
jgi:hypothetical protein